MDCESRWVDPPATAGGTDLLQVRMQYLSLGSLVDAFSVLLIQIYKLLSKLSVSRGSAGEQASMKSKVYGFSLEACALLNILWTISA